MSSNRPLFDDEDLPDWMKDAGITPAGGDQKTPGQPAGHRPPDDFDLSWLPDESTNNIPTAQPGGAADDFKLDWGVLGDLQEPSSPSSFDWERTVADTAMPGSEPADDQSWLQSFAAEPADESTGAVSGLDWSDLVLPPVEPMAAPEPIVPSDDLSWLDQALDEPAPLAEETPSGPVKRIQRLPKADESPAEPPAAPKIKRLGSAADEPPAAAPKIKKLSSAADESPAEPPAAPKIKRLSSQSPGQPAEAIPADMTFEEWERLQVQKEQEAQSDPADKLLDEVPDWFSASTPETPAESPADEASSPEFLPDWYMGMEEQSQADAPDWFANMDLGSTPLVGPESIQAPPVIPAAPSASASENVPDWFKGAGVDEIDFDSVFSSQAETPEPPQRAKRPSSRMAAYVPPAPEITESPVPSTPPITAEPASEPADAALDWMADLPDLDALVGSAEPSTPEIASVQPAPSTAITESSDWAESLDWGLDAATGDSTAGELEKADLPDWMRQAAPPQPVTPDTKLDDLDWSAFEETPQVDDTIASRKTMPTPPPQRFERLQQSVPPPPTEPAPAPGEWDWLSSEGLPEIFAETPAAETETPAADADMPAWMRDLSTVEAKPAQTPSLEPTAQAEGEMDWLSGMDFSESSVPAPAAEPAAPGWTIDQLNAEEDTGAGFDIDSLLSLSEEAAASVQAAPAEPEIVEPEIGGMLPPLDQEPQALTPAPTAFDMDSLFGAETQETLPQAVPAETDILESILPPTIAAESAPPRVGRRVAPESAEPAIQETPKSREELPEWIAEMQPERAPTVLRIGDQEIRVQEKPLAQLSDQLKQLRERAKAIHAVKAEPAPSTTVGPLSGITGTIAALPDVLKSGTAMTAVTPVISDIQARRVKLIQSILERDEEAFKRRQQAEDEREAQQAAEAAQPALRTRPRPKIDRIVISLLLAVAIVVPFFTNVANLAQSPGKQLTPTQNAVAQSIDAIQTGQSVLVAFEYGPTGAGELDDLARVILRDLIKRGVRPVIVSTNPSGVLHAQSLMVVMGDNPSELTLMKRAAALIPHKDYLVMRYLPGGAAGVRAMTSAVLSGGFQRQIVFATDIEGKPSNLTDTDIASIRNNPAFVLTESQEEVRNWAEQYKVEQSATLDKPLTIVLLSSASASAVAQTYVSSAADKRIRGPLVGLRDSMIYQAARQGVSNLAEQRWQSIAMGVLLASVVILLGVAVNLLRSLRRRKPVDSRTS